MEIRLRFETTSFNLHVYGNGFLLGFLLVYTRYRVSLLQVGSYDPVYVKTRK